MQRRLSQSTLSRRTIPHTRLEEEIELESIYEIKDLLGQGSFGSVHLARHLASDLEWAIKIIDKKKAGTSGARMLEFEIAILKRVSHEYIITLKEIFETSKKSYIVMEYCRGGTLQAHYLASDGHPAYSPLQVSTITRRIASAVSYLHDNDIAHRDLKLDNIMLAPTAEDPLIIKVTDFGLCALKSKEGPQMQMVCGTPCYMAPEVLADAGTYSPLCDIWSIGVILYNLLSGQLPFVGDAQGTLEDKIQQGIVHFSEKIWPSVNSSAKDLLLSMLRVDPARRITAKEILDHPWITGGDTSAMGNVLEMMKQHAMIERLASRSPMSAGGESADDRQCESPVNIPPPAITPDIGPRKTSSLRTKTSLVSTPGPTSPRPVPNYMRPTKASSASALVATSPQPSEPVRVTIRLPPS